MRGKSVLSVIELGMNAPLSNYPTSACFRFSFIDKKDNLESWKDTVQPFIMFVHCTIETILQKAAEKRNQFVPIGTLETIHDCIILILLSDVSSDGRLIF